jgi:hypothetical protein
MCKRLDPTCEGLVEECETLSPNAKCSGVECMRGFHPRVAEAIASCWVGANMKGRTCRTKQIGSCIRAAVSAACVDPEVEPVCDQLMDKCKKAKHPLKYTKDECVKVMSSVIGEMRGWAEQQLGPVDEGGGIKSGCKLDYALPYYPFMDQP